MHTDTRLRRTVSAVLLALMASSGLAGLLGGLALAQDDGRTVGTTEVSGPITPVIADHLEDTVARADAEGHAALVVELDTPGGLVTSMREIVQTFLNAPLPVVVYVSPSGADAGSAGTFVTLAAHVAGMAPATTIGAATPIDLQGGEVGDKVVNNAAAYARAIAEERGRDVEFAVDSVRDGRSITADEAAEIGAVDLLADDLEDLLDAVDGTAVTLGDGREVTLATANARPVELDMSLARRILQTLADPNLAFIFISIGTLGIVYEVANPGIGAGGVLGAVMLILAMFSLSVLPVDFAGAALLVLAGALFLIEVFVPGIGVAAAGGSVALVLGGLFLFDEPTGLGIDPWVLVPSAVLLFGLVIVAGRLVAGIHRTPSRAASDDLIGREAVVHRSAGDRGRVRLDGTWWRARSTGEPLHNGTTVEVVDRENIDLIVTPVTGSPPDAGENGPDQTVHQTADENPRSQP